MPFLSVVIPAFNERPRIVGTLEQVVGYLTLQSYTWEVLVVDDGSSDGTADLVREFGDERPEIRLIQAPHGGAH